jgi:hypothetical protein
VPLRLGFESFSFLCHRLSLNTKLAGTQFTLSQYKRITYVLSRSASLKLPIQVHPITPKLEKVNRLNILEKLFLSLRNEQDRGHCLLKPLRLPAVQP